MALIMVRTPTGETYLMSAGKNDSGTLGQGQNIKESKTFTKLAYDNTKIKFADVSMYDDHAMAID